MSTGYDEDGVEDIICLGPPGGDDDGGGDDGGDGRVTACGTTLPQRMTIAGVTYRIHEGVFDPIWRGFYDDYVPNCNFGGWQTLYRTPLTADLRFTPAGGVNVDLSMEFWIKFRLDPTYNYGAAPGPGVPRITNFAGVGANAVDLVADNSPHFGLISYGGAIYARYVDAGPTTLEIDITNNITQRNPWHHIVITVARGGNMIAYVDGVQAGTIAGVIAYTIDAPRGLGIQMGDSDGSDDRLGWYGPMALHSAVLTPAQVGDAYHGKTITINANTECAYDFRPGGGGQRGMQLNPAVRAADYWYWMWVDNRVGAGSDLGTQGLTLDENGAFDYSMLPGADVGRGALGELYALVTSGCGAPTGAEPLYPWYPDLSGNDRHLGMFIGAGGPVAGASLAWSNDPFWR
jgi:hypothetical protein